MNRAVLDEDCLNPRAIGGISIRNITIEVAPDSLFGRAPLMTLKAVRSRQK